MYKLGTYLESFVPASSHEAIVIGSFHPVAGLDRSIMCCHLDNMVLVNTFQCHGVSNG